MNMLKAKQNLLTQSYNQLQDRFGKYYNTGLDTNATYTFKNKTLTCTNNFTEIFLRHRNAYSLAYSQFTKARDSYNTHRYKLFNKANYNLRLWKFHNKLYLNFGNIIQERRKSDLNKQHNEELNIDRANLHNFTDLKIDHSLNSTLCKGPNFIPTSPTPENEINKMYSSSFQNALSRYAKAITGITASTYGTNMALKLNLNHPNINTSNLSYVLDVLDKRERFYTVNTEHPNNNNNNYTQLQHIKRIHNLAKRPDIIVNVADKNLGFCINSTKWYVQEYDRQLSDNNVYTQVPYDNMADIITKGLKDLHILHDKYINVPELKRFDLHILKHRDHSEVKIPSLNITPKVHKLENKASPELEAELKGRPIVNGFNTLTTEPSKLLGQLFRQCLIDITRQANDEGITSPIVSNSKEIVDRLLSIPFSKLNLDNVYFITFDFSSLYTSIKKWTVFDTIHFLGAHLNLSKNMIKIMKELFNFIKQYAYFTVGNNSLYLQKEGFAMGSYDSADGANLVLFKAEYYMMKNSQINKHILDFFRFIDDGSLVVYIQQDCINDFLTKLASHYPRELEIEFKVNKFQVDFLDITFGIGHSTYNDGKCYYHIHQKKFNTYTYTHYSSNHPSGVFKGIISTECHRYRRLSCNYMEYAHIVGLFTRRLLKCGYPKEFIKHMLIPYLHNQNTCMYKNTGRYATTLCKISFNRLYNNKHKLLKFVLHNKYNGKNAIKICNTTNTKLKTLLLTKKKLHNKLYKYMHG